MALEADTAHGGFFYMGHHPGIGEDKAGNQGMSFTATGAIDSLNPEDNTVTGGFALVGAVFVELETADGAGSGPGAYGLHVDSKHH